MKIWRRDRPSQARYTDKAGGPWRTHEAVEDLPASAPHLVDDGAAVADEERVACDRVSHEPAPVGMAGVSTWEVK